MTDKQTFVKIVIEKFVSANTKLDSPRNVIDMRLYIGGSVICSGVYNIWDLDDLWNKVKDEEEDWFIDFYENFFGEDRAEYIDVCLWKADVFKKEEEETEKRYRFSVKNIEYGYIDVYATSMKDALAKAECFDGDYMVKDNYPSFTHLETFNM